jgi:hypothetical protein
MILKGGNGVQERILPKDKMFPGEKIRLKENIGLGKKCGEGEDVTQR